LFKTFENHAQIKKVIMTSHFHNAAQSYMSIYYFSKFVMTSHANHWLFGMIFLFLLFRTTFIPDYKFPA